MSRSQRDTGSAEVVWRQGDQRGPMVYFLEISEPLVK